MSEEEMKQTSEEDCENKKECCKNDENNQEKECKHKKLLEKIDELENSLADKDKVINEMTQKANQILSTASYYKNEAESAKKDFDRYKERNKNIETELKQKTNEDIAKKLLPILDNFEQAISHTDELVMKGFEMIYNSMLKVLSELGVEEITAEGDLDPELHNCIMTEPCEDDEKDGKIACVYQKGYKFSETNKVVRPASVSVYKK